MSEAKSNRVQLGCGTLILIALIVLIFSGRTKIDDLQRNVQDLNKQIIVLQQKVESLSKCVESGGR